MHYPKLIRLAKHFSKETVVSFDEWLGHKKKGSRIVPGQFISVPEKTALELFIMCAQLGILDIQYRVECPKCKKNLQPSKREGIMNCLWCKTSHHVRPEDIHIRFVV